jgi:hypothetical protein
MKRILELAEQADEYTEQTVHYYQGQFNGLTWESKIKQTRDTKFAELIVRECARVAANLTEGDEELNYNSGRTWAGIDVLEHFGVKE